MTGGQGVAGSNPAIPTIFSRYLPVTWVTFQGGESDGERWRAYDRDGCDAEKRAALDFWRRQLKAVLSGKWAAAAGRFKM